MRQSVVCGEITLIGVVRGGIEMEDKQQEFLDLLKKVREEKDIDQIAELFLSVTNMYGLTVDEVCALSFYMVDATLSAGHNKAFIAQHFNIDVDRLGVDGKLAIEKAMLAVYMDKMNGKA